MTCLNCGRVQNCKRAPEVALSIFLRVKRLTEAPAIFEATAMSCSDFMGAKKRRVKSKEQMQLFA